MELPDVKLDPSRLRNPVSTTVSILILGAIVGLIIGVFFFFLGTTLALTGPLAFLMLPAVIAQAATMTVMGVFIIPVWAVVGGWFFANLGAGGSGSIARGMGVKLLESDHDIVKRVHTMCEQLAIPQVKYIGFFESEDINAFAAGTSQDNALVAFSRGAIAKLTGEQFMAVMAHELAHVANKDMHRMTMARGVQDSLTWFLIFRGLKNVARWMFSFVSEIEILRLSRKREFYADAIGAVLVSPSDMIGALQAIINDKAEPSRQQKRFANLMFRSNAHSFFSTHPPLDRRIEAIRNREYIYRLPIKLTAENAA
ncbi:M48 family metalloprotease [uncultured Cohaesibacter sp.]|uniref:M48 family metalloprotease n=1 Tax=uncultured Cohaesibacter sp. TaxID=1002546 RepID=UPI00292CCB53|nr:M48 family metalloprotease [uncultured Cohaesibacter sp.]